MTHDESHGRLVAELDDALEAARVPYILIGGLASSLLGRTRTTDDVDILVRADDADHALSALADAGFVTERTNPQWIYKAWKDEILIDVIFWLKGGITLDDEMLLRASIAEIAGRRVRVMPPEDLIVVKAIAHDEQSPRHWHDALGIVASRPLDWTYLVRRARPGPRRVLSFLIYAQSNDLIVSEESIEALYRMVYGEPRPLAAAPTPRAAKG